MAVSAPETSCRTLLRQGRHADAAALAETGLQCDPEAGGLWHLLGLAQLFLGDAARAASSLRRALDIDGENAPAWDHLGVALQRTGRHAEAASAFERSLTLAGGVASTWANAAGNACERRTCAEALRYATRALALDPSLPPAMLAMGNALLALGRLDEAERWLKLAAESAPDLIEAVVGLAAVYSEAGRNELAIPLLERVVVENPQLLAARANLATARYRTGELEQALAHYRVALDLAPRDAGLWSACLFAQTHAEGLSPGEVFAAHRAFGEAFACPLADSDPWHEVVRDPQRRLRLGFVSGDLRDHALTYFLEPVWQRLASEGFELHAYHTSAVEDAVSARLRSRVDAWVAVHAFDDDALEARIRADAIDILFDLSGHTRGNRLPVFARKPAPIQISWMGYPFTTGLRAIDYRLVNAHAASAPGLDAWFTERLLCLRLGNRFVPPSPLPPLAPLPALTGGHFTFGSFARVAKITSSTVALWSAALRQTDTARMLIGGVGEGVQRSRILGLFAAGGIAASRIEFRPHMGLHDYLRLHGEVDLLLDSVPYSGGTTINHGLWMGVPTLTFAPDDACLQQRHGAGMMAEAGLGEWVAHSETEFLDKVATTVRAPQALATLRAGMRVHLAAANERNRRGDDLGALLRQMWEAWCAGRVLVQELPGSSMSGRGFEG